MSDDERITISGWHDDAGPEDLSDAGRLALQIAQCHANPDAIEVLVNGVDHVTVLRLALGILATVPLHTVITQFVDAGGHDPTDDYRRLAATFTTPE